MVLIPARVDGVSTVIIGYGPGPKGPQAIVIWQSPDGSYCPRAVPLSDVRLVGLPKKLLQKLQKAHPGYKITEVD